MDSNPPSPETSASASRGRRRLLALAYLASLALLAEAVSWLGLSILAGHAASGAELGARMALVGELEQGQADPGAAIAANGRRIVHPYLGYLMRSWTPERDQLVRLNMPALYEPNSPIHDDDPDTVVIAVSGGSVAMGFVELLGARQLAEHLRGHPRFAEKQFRFVSLSVGGWKQPQQLMALNLLLAMGGHVDLMIDLSGFNEVCLHELENQDQGVAPIYPRSWYFISGEGAAGAGLEELEDAHRDRVRAARAALDSPWRRSWTYRLWWSWNDQRLARTERRLQEELRAIEKDAQQRSPSELVALGPRIQGADRSERLDELVRIWSSSALQMHHLCEANGIEFFECLQPNQYVPDSKPLTADEREHAIDTDPERYQPLVVGGYPRLRAAGVELRDLHGVRFVDLTSIYEDVRETVYVDDCCHVNELGNARMAEEIAQAVLAATR